jgi:hypothetical protein
MSEAEPMAAWRRLAPRAWALLTRPNATWERIDEDVVTYRDIYRNWVLPLAAVPAVCDAIGKLVFGIGIFGVGLRPSLGAALAEMLASYLVSLATVWLLALAIDVAARPFEAEPNRVQALKLAAYSATAFWLAGVFDLYPPVGWLAGMLGVLWSLILLSKGLPRLMHNPPEQQLSYFAVVLLSGFGIVVVLSALTAWMRDLGGPLYTVATLGAPT